MRRGAKDKLTVAGTYRLQAAHVQSWHLWCAFIQHVHHGFDGNRLAIAWRTVEDETSFPRHSEFSVGFLRLKERNVVIDDGLLHILVQDNIFPRCLHDAGVQFCALAPETAIKYPNFLVQLRTPSSSSGKEGRSLVLICRENVVVDVAGVRGLCSVDNVHNEVVILPFVHEFAEGIRRHHQPFTARAAIWRQEDLLFNFSW